jgi:hypothetical protein
MRESSIYQTLLAKGHSVGYAEAFVQGFAEGRLEGARRALVILCQVRFGPPDAPTRAYIEAINDLDRLEYMIAESLDVASWHDVLGIQLPPQRNRLRRPAR